MKLLAAMTALLLVSPILAQQGTPGKKPTKTTGAKPAPAQQPPKQPPVGVKGAGQVAGGVLRFGDLFALKSGFTYQILSARYTLEPFECYGTLAPATDEKLLILTVAIKNNRRDSDNFFGGPSILAVDAKGTNYEGSSYMLASQPRVEFHPNLKPGQGLGQNPSDPVTVAIQMPRDTRVVKLILKEGREGTNEEVTRFFIAGASEAEAGGKPDPKNVIAPLPAWAEKGAVVGQNQYLPTYTYQFKLTGFSTADRLGDAEPEEGKRWVFAHVTVRNPFHSKQDLFDFSGGDSVSELVLKDEDGEKYPASRFLKAKRDESYDGDLEPGEEGSYRIAFQVPKDAKFKTALLGAPRGNRYLFDATPANK